MKKTIPLTNYILAIKNELIIILILLCSSFAYSQASIIPTKTVTVRPGVCGIIDVELKIQGSNPVSRPLEVVLVIDVSGSMDDDIKYDPNNSLEYAQDAANDFIRKIFLPANNPTGKNKVAIVKYSSTASLVRPLTLAAGQTDLINAINSLAANGTTNIQDGIIKADKELYDHGTFDCITSRSIILLTDGVANRTGNNQSCSDGINGSCIQSAITAANNAKTTTKSGIVYNNQIFSVGLFGAIYGSQQSDAEYTLNKIQSAGNFFTENSADLTGIYTQIFSKLSWVAQQISGTPFSKEIVSTDFSIGNITASKGTASASGQNISWNIDFLNVETITLKYELTPKSNVCGTKTVSSSRLDYKNSACQTAFLNVTTPTTLIPCPAVSMNSKQDVDCYGGATASITLNDATGGTTPYSYSWKKDGTSFAATKNISGLEAGLYTVIATDKNGCSSSPLSVTIKQPTAALTATVASTDVSCFGAKDGTITISNATGGYGTYQYSINGGTTWQDAASFNALADGTYNVQIRDKAKNTCTATYEQ